MSMIKNETPYAGTPKLNFEKNSNYYDENLGILNKIHVDLGFTKLVSRVMPVRIGENPYELNQAKIDEIQRDTRGIIGTYEWWTKKCACGDGTTYETTARPTPEEEENSSHNQLPNCFMTREGEYIGDIEVAWWYHKNTMVVNEKNRLVPVKLKSYNHGLDTELPYKKFMSAVIKKDQVDGFYGYTHKGGQLFKLGDRLFDAEYEPVESDFEPGQLLEWKTQYEYYLSEAIVNNDEFEIEELQKEGVSAFIPFNLRGKKVIKKWQKAEEAAINLTKYLVKID